MRHLIAFILLIGGLVSASLGMMLVFARWQTPQERLLFQAESGELYTIRIDGSGMQPFFELEHVPPLLLSPDRQWMTFLVRDSQNSQYSGLYSIRTDDGSAKKIVPGEFVHLGAWTPDNQWIVYDQQNTISPFVGDALIYRIRPDGSHLEQIAKGEFASMSRDGKWLITRSRSTDGINQLYRVAFDNFEDVRRLTYIEGNDANFLAWSPDANWIIFIAGRYDLYRMQLEDQFAQPLVVSPFFENNFASPTNTSPLIEIYANRQTTKYASGMYRMNADASQFQRIGDPAWGNSMSPNQEWIFLTQQIDNKMILARVHPDSSHERVFITGNPSSSFSSWSPDGQWLIFVDETYGLYRMRPDGSQISRITPPNIRLDNFPLFRFDNNLSLNYSRLNVFNVWLPPIELPYRAWLLPLISLLLLAISVILRPKRLYFSLAMFP